jgi:hypothetical protein
MPFRLNVARTPVSETLAQGDPLTEMMRAVAISAVCHLSLRTKRNETGVYGVLHLSQHLSEIGNAQGQSRLPKIPRKAYQMLAYPMFPKKKKKTCRTSKSNPVLSENPLSIVRTNAAATREVSTDNPIFFEISHCMPPMFRVAVIPKQ